MLLFSVNSHLLFSILLICVSPHMKDTNKVSSKSLKRQKAAAAAAEEEGRCGDVLTHGGVVGEK